MYRRELPRVSPEAVGIPSAAVQRLIEKLETCGTEMNGFMLARHGCVASECWWAPFHRDLVHINHSLGKSYVITAIALTVVDLPSRGIPVRITLCPLLASKLL